MLLNLGTVLTLTGIPLQQLFQALGVLVLSCQLTL